MFTGLVRTQGTIRSITTDGDTVMAIEADDALPLSLGASIACHGMCLTVTAFEGKQFTVSLSAETLRCTNAGSWQVGTRINLEPSLCVGDAMGGHFVSGHVDGLGKVTRTEKSGASTIWEFEVPAALARFIAPKGSITIDGVSLTVNTVDAHRFTVNIIPHTAEVTGFKTLAVGDSVNLEIDMLARYVARLQECA
jgi:riboflavin synthase